MELGVVAIMIGTLFAAALFQFVIGIFFDGMPKTDF
jgi:hypothetical protein